MPWPRFWDGGVRSPKKKPTFPNRTITSYKNWKKWNLATNFTPLLARVLLCRATGFERTMTHLPSRVNSFFATNFCFLHNRLSTGTSLGFRTLFPAFRPENCRTTPVLENRRENPAQGPCCLLPFVHILYFAGKIKSLTDSLRANVPRRKVAAPGVWCRT